MEVFIECPRLDQGGERLIEGWLTAHPAARLVVVDILTPVRGHRKRATQYEADYEALMGLAGVARRRRVAILIVYHSRKAVVRDFVDAVNGTNGLAGAADGVWVLTRGRGRADATLYVVHREGPERELAMSFDAEKAEWSVSGEGGDFSGTEAQHEIVGELRVRGGMTPLEIAEVLGKNVSTVGTLLARMKEAGLVRSERGRYHPCDGV